MGEGCITKNYKSSGAVNVNFCAATKASSLAIKVIANVNALTFNDTDKDDSTVEKIYKGVEILMASDGTTGAASFLGGKATGTTTTDVCVSTDSITICNNNDGTNYKTIS